MSKEILNTNDRKETPSKRYDLEERTARFGEAVIVFAKQLPMNRITDPLVSQIVRAGTSIGANYCEANDAGSRKEFSYRISLCKRETRESTHWLRMVAAAVPDMTRPSRDLWSEAKELHLIFAAIDLKTASRGTNPPRRPK